MKKFLLKTQTILALVCFLILAPVASLYAQVLPETNGVAIDPPMLFPETDQSSNTDDEPIDPFADKYYDEITGGYYDNAEDIFNPNAVCTSPDCEVSGTTESDLLAGGSDDATVRAEYNNAVNRARGTGQGYAYAGGQTGTASSSQTAPGGALSAASCIGSQILGKLLASVISSAVGNIAQSLIDGAKAVVGAVISVPTNELGSVKYDTQRAKEQIQFSNATDKGVSVGFAGINALAGVSWDSVAYCIVNSMIDYVARSTIAWARSGFQGNPSFIQNPGQFFKQLADVEASTFLQNLAYGTIGQNICQPFKAQLVLNIARDFTGGVGQSQVTGGGVNGGYSTGGFNGAGLPTATVGTGGPGGALNTTSPTYNGVSGANNLAAKSANGTYGGCSLDQINNNLKGFLGGNFNQGGWNSWLQLTQINTNNPYSNYISLSAQLRSGVQQKKTLASVELGWGRGFLSFRKCEEKTPQKDQSKCPITTPGNLIEGQLEKTLGISKDRLVLAEKFDQVIAVVVDQLISTALNKVLDNF